MRRKKQTAHAFGHTGQHISVRPSYLNVAPTQNNAAFRSSEVRHFPLKIFLAFRHDHIDSPRQDVHRNFTGYPLFAVKIPHDAVVRFYLEM